MNRFKTISAILLALFMASCSSKSTPPQPLSYEKLSAEKAVEIATDDSFKKRIEAVKIGSDGNQPTIYKAAIKGDKIAYITDNQTVNKSSVYDFILFGKYGYTLGLGTIGHNGSEKEHAVCGYSIIGTPHRHQNSEACNTRFVSTNYLLSGFAGATVAVSSLGLSLLTNGNMNFALFDRDEFREAVVKINLDNLRYDFIELINPQKKGFVYEVLYIDSYDIDSSDSEEKVEYDGVIFIDGASGTVYGFYDYSDINSSNYSKTINEIINSLYTNIATEKNTIYENMLSRIPAKIPEPVFPPPKKLVKSEFETHRSFLRRTEEEKNDREAMIRKIQTDYDMKVDYNNRATARARDKNIALNNKTILSLIPPKIPEPVIPPPKKLIKSEFEKQSEFEARVRQAAIDRESMIKEMQIDYDKKVATRNRFVADLEERYKKEADKQKARRESLIALMNDNIEDLSKLLFVRYMNGFKATDMRYDAENEKLYFTLISKNENYKNSVVADIPPENAKHIKERGEYLITPKLDYSKGVLYIEGFNIKDGKSGSNYAINYTNKSYEPTQMAVSIANENEYIAANEQINFNEYKQTPTDLIAYDKKEVWSIDVVSRADAAVPKWFEKLQTSSERLYGFGMGGSLEEAYDVARANLIRNMQSDISVTSSLKHESTSSSQLYTEYDKKIEVSANTELNKEQYREYKKEKFDGMWYVVLEYMGS